MCCPEQIRVGMSPANIHIHHMGTSTPNRFKKQMSSSFTVTNCADENTEEWRGRIVDVLEGRKGLLQNLGFLSTRNGNLDFKKDLTEGELKVK